MKEQVKTIRTLQQLMYQHGLTEFRELLKQAAYHASEDMEDISTEKSEAYSEFAQSLEE